MASTLLPFLYHTRTILRSDPRTTIAFARSLHATSQRLKRKDDIPFVLEVGEENNPPEPEPEPASARRSTITPSERQVFERIFTDIRARGLQPVLQDGSPSAATNRSAMIIMQQAAKDAGQSHPTTVAAPGLLAGAARDRNKALLRFPPELRAAASKALNTIENSAVSLPSDDDIAYDEASISAGQGDGSPDEGWKSPPHTLNRTLELENQRYPERLRVEGLMTSATTDFELWDILEKEVFTMPAKLGIDRGPSKPEESEESDSKPGRKKKQKTAADETKNRSEDAITAADEVENSKITLEETDGIADENSTMPGKLSLYVYGPLYPAYLLLALRRLNTAFHSPSPLTFSVLPRIKELGLESYVLGVSTPFYNELLEIYWTRRGDLTGMLNLLEEMRHCGIYFDTQTTSILNRVDTALSTLATGKTGSSFGRVLMTMPEYHGSLRGRIRYWHRAVDLSVRERQQDIAY